MRIGLELLPLFHGLLLVCLHITSKADKRVDRGMATRLCAVVCGRDFGEYAREVVGVENLDCCNDYRSVSSIAIYSQVDIILIKIVSFK